MIITSLSIPIMLFISSLVITLASDYASILNCRSLMKWALGVFQTKSCEVEHQVVQVSVLCSLHTRLQHASITCFNIPVMYATILLLFIFGLDHKEELVHVQRVGRNGVGMLARIWASIM